MQTAGGINAGGIASAKLADGAVVASKIGPLAVTSAKIADGAVGLAKLGADAKARMGAVVLWSGAALMRADQTVTFAAAGGRKASVADQPNGIVLVFSKYDSSTGKEVNRYWSSFFVPKQVVASSPGTGHCFFSHTTDSPAMAKYIYISDNYVTGCDDNNKKVANGGVTYDNSIFVLRRVIGV